MMPVYRTMDSYQMDSVATPQFYSPACENLAPHIRVDASNPVMTHEYWPYGGYYGSPVPYHGCCNHAGFPGYNGLTPHCPHQAPCFHCCGNYAGCVPVQHFLPYYVPPPHHSVGHPRYEYDKNMPRDQHCYGYPNNACYQKNGAMRIEEHESEAEKQENKTMVPAEFKNHQHPIVWIPQEQLKDNEEREPVESQVGSWNQASSDRKAPGNTNVPEDSTWWFPFNMDGIKPLMQGQEGNKAKSQKDEDKPRQHPFPVFWMPYYSKQQEDREKEETEYAQLPGLKPSQVKGPESDTGTDGKAHEEGRSASKMSADAKEKAARIKEIPVKQLEDGKRDNSSDKDRGTRVALERAEDGVKDKRQTARRKQLKSPPKALKLPPVCLRVDPLPKKKNGNGSSRSPSPPRHKGRPSETEEGRSKVSASSMSKGSDANQKEVKPIPVICVSGSDEARKETTGSEIQPAVKTTEAYRNRQEKLEKVEDVTCMSVEEGGKTSGANTCRMTVGEASTRGKTAEEHKQTRSFSADEAATMIQSAYRGYDVRRWEPLKKLKQMAKVRDQMAEVKSRIQALEALSDHGIDEKQIVMSGEMIMTLLLKLDAIQGLHPCLRDIRKSLARELVVLQEKLDCLKKCKPVEEAPVAKPTSDSRSETMEEATTKEPDLVSKTEASNAGPDADDVVTETGDMYRSQPGNEDSKDSPLGMEESAGSIEGNAEPHEDMCHALEEDERPILDVNKDENIELLKELPGGAADDDGPASELNEIDLNEDENLETLPQDATGTERANCELQMENVDEERVFELRKKLPQGASNCDVSASEQHNENVIRQAANASETDRAEEPSELPVGVVDEDQKDLMLPVDKKEEEPDPDATIHARSPDEEVLQLPVGLLENERTESPVTIEAVVDTQHRDQQQKAESNEKVARENMEEPETHDVALATEEAHETKEILPASRTDDVAANMNVEPENPQKTHQPPTDPLSYHEPPLESSVKNLQQTGGTQGKTCTSNRHETKTEAPKSPTGSESSFNHMVDGDKKLIEENQRLREMMEKLMEAGKEQVAVISSLTERVKDLEKKLSKRKKLGMARRRSPSSPASSCAKQTKNSVRDGALSGVM